MVRAQVASAIKSVTTGGNRRPNSRPLLELREHVIEVMGVPCRGRSTEFPSSAQSRRPTLLQRHDRREESLATVATRPEGLHPLRRGKRSTNIVKAQKPVEPRHADSRDEAKTCRHVPLQPALINVKVGLELKGSPEEQA